MSYTDMQDQNRIDEIIEAEPKQETFRPVK